MSWLYGPLLVSTITEETVTPVVTVQVGGGGEVPSWREVLKAAYKKNHAKEELKKEKKELAKLEKKIKEVSAQAKSPAKVEGVLARVLELHEERKEKKAQIRQLEITLDDLSILIAASQADEDEDDELLLLH